MNAERQERARRFAAARKWVWIPGVSAVGSVRVGRYDLMASHRVTMVDEHGPWTTTGRRASASGSRTRHSIIEDPIPDLDDELTRTGGLLLVVRLAIQNADVVRVRMDDGDPSPRFLVVGEIDGEPRQWPQWPDFPETSEELALLAALEAASE